MMQNQSGLKLTPNPNTIASDVPLSVGPVKIEYDTVDANAEHLKFSFPAASATQVPVTSFGIGIKDVDLTWFNGLTQPHIAVVDTDRDSAIGLGFNADDVPEISWYGSAGALQMYRSGVPLALRNTTVQADNQVLVMRGPDQAGAEAIGDELYASFEQDTADGLVETVRLTSELLDVSTGTIDARFTISVVANSVLTEMFQIDSSSSGVITTTIPTGDIILKDNVSMRFGSAGDESDLQSDGSNTTWDFTNGELYLNSSSALATYLTVANATATTKPRYVLRRADGVFGTPTVITTGDELGSVDVYGYSGAGGYVHSAAIEFDSEGTVATTRVPGVIRLRTGTDAAPTVLTTAVTINSAQVTTISTVDINGGNIDGTAIGAASASTIKGTTIDATTDFTVDGLVLTADNITNDAALTVTTSSGDLTLSAAPGSDVLIGDNATILYVDGGTDTLGFGRASMGNSNVFATFESKLLTIPDSGEWIEIYLRNGNAKTVATATSASWVGVLIGAQAFTVNGTLTTATSLRVTAPSDGAGTDYSMRTIGSATYALALADSDTATLWVNETNDSTDVAGGIVFGSSQDTNLYRSASNTLTTDDNLTVTGNLSVADGAGVIIGHTAQVDPWTLIPELQILGTGQADSAMVVGRYSPNASEPAFYFLKSRGATIGGSGLVEDGDSAGLIRYAVDDGSDLASAVAEIEVEIDDTAAENDTPGRIVLRTTVGGANQATERWRIDNAGNLSSAGAVSNVSADGAVIATGGIAFTDVANAWIDDATQGTGTVTHYIGNQTIDTTASDARLKTKWSPPNGLAREHLMVLGGALEEYNYVPETLGGERFVGFGAQHLAKVLPQYVVKGKGENHWSVEYKYMVGPLLWGWQDHEVRIKELEAQVIALGGALGE